MKKFIKFFILILILGILFTSCSCGRYTPIANRDKNSFLYLFAGFDDAAENTDVLFTLGYEKDTNTVRVAQIPRDTYFNFGNAQNKINQFYATKRAEGYDREAAMDMTVTALGEAFGTEFDGYIGISTDAFVKIIDGLGGVDIEISNDLEISLDGDEPLILKAGLNHVDGYTAERFVRYRKGYATQDLGRLDAQKVFLNAVFAKISSGMSLPAILSVASVMQQNALTDVRLSDCINMLIGGIRSDIPPTTYFTTLPGEAVTSKSGLSYYVLNKRASADAVKKYMFAHLAFDRMGKLYSRAEQSFLDVYEDENQSYREYSNDNVKDISVKTTN
jgi:LCP family protein required for cell wall assembly